MPFLLDTCVISELAKPKPNPKVREELLGFPRDELHLSSITIAEIEYGIQIREDPEERERLTKWLHLSIMAAFGDRILPLDVFVAQRWGQLVAQLKSRHLKMPVQDSYIAATALEFGLTLVTRNVADFANSGVSVLNPWK